MGWIWRNRSKEFYSGCWLNSRQLVCQCEGGEELKEIVFSMLKHTKSTTENLYYLQGRLFDFFSVLAREITLRQFEDVQRKVCMFRRRLIISRIIIRRGLR